MASDISKDVQMVIFWCIKCLTWSWKQNLSVSSGWSDLCKQNAPATCILGCFTKTLFFKKKKGIPSRVPLGHIQHISKSFIRLDKSKGSNQLMKNEGFLHCRFSLSPLMATLRDAFPFQNVWIFGKVPKGGGGHFQSKNLYCRFWTFK